jgi:hypothetical protein
MFSGSLIGLMSFHNQYPEVKLIKEYRDDLIENLEKVIKWTEREDDGTVDKKDLIKARKEAKEIIQWVKKIWKK